LLGLCPTALELLDQSLQHGRLRLHGLRARHLLPEQDLGGRAGERVPLQGQIALLDLLLAKPAPLVCACGIARNEAR
jgi:hypothetical protein